MISNLYSEELRNRIKKFKKFREELKDSIYKEILDILKHSKYGMVEIEQGIFVGYDKDGFETEDSIDNIVIDLIHDFDKLSSEKLSVTLCRGLDF